MLTPVTKVLSREEMAELYWKLDDNSMFCREESDRMETIRKELGTDFLVVCRLKRKQLEDEKQIYILLAERDKLKERVSRLETCVEELFKYKRNTKEVQDTPWRFYAECKEKLPSLGEVAGIYRAPAVVPFFDVEGEPT
jgi:hypothetical protein